RLVVARCERDAREDARRQPAGIDERRARCAPRTRSDRRACGAGVTRRDHRALAERSVKVLLTLQDVEPAVRLNAMLEREGVDTDVVSPLDDIRAALRREKPDIIVFSGDLADPSTIALVKDQLWEGAAAIG